MIGFQRMRLLALVIALQLVLAACATVPTDSAAVVNGQAIPVHFYDVMVNASKRRAEQVGIPVAWETPQGAKRLTTIQTETIKRLVQNTVVDQLAKEKGVSVSDADLDSAITRIQAAFGGATAVDQRLDQGGMTRDDFRSLYRYFLLDQKLRQVDPSGYPAALDQSLKAAKVQVFVAPCTNNHDYATCLNGGSN